MNRKKIIIFKNGELTRVMVKNFKLIFFYFYCYYNCFCLCCPWGPLNNLSNNTNITFLGAIEAEIQLFDRFESRQNRQAWPPYISVNSWPKKKKIYRVTFFVCIFPVPNLNKIRVSEVGFCSKVCWYYMELPYYFVNNSSWNFVKEINSNNLSSQLNKRNPVPIFNRFCQVSA